MTQNQQERLHKIFEDLNRVFCQKKEATLPEEKARSEEEYNKLQKEKDALQQELLLEERFLGIDFGEITPGTCLICGDYIWDNEVDRDEAFFEGGDSRPPHHNRCLATFMKTGKLLPHHTEYYQNPEKFFANEDGVSYEEMGRKRGEFYQQAVVEGWSHLLTPIKRMSWDEVVAFLTERAMERGFVEGFSKAVSASAGEKMILAVMPDVYADHASETASQAHSEEAAVAETVLVSEQVFHPVTVSDILAGKVAVPVFACRTHYRPEIMFRDTFTKEPDLIQSEEEKSILRFAQEQGQPITYVVFAPANISPDPEKSSITREELCDVGVLAELHAEHRDDGVFAAMRALERVKIAWNDQGLATLTHLSEIQDLDFNLDETKNKIEAIFMVVKDVQLETFSPDAVNIWFGHQAAIKAGKFGSLLDLFAFYVGRGSAWEAELFPYRYAVLRANVLSDRLEKTVELAAYFHGRVKFARGVLESTHQERAKKQHHIHVRGQIAELEGQISVLRAQLGEGDDEIKEWEAKLKEFEALKSPLPPLAITEAQRVLKRIKRYKPEDSPYAKYAEWLNNFFSLSWTERTKDNFDLKNVFDILEADHYGITHVNKRIVDYAALLKNRDAYRELVAAGKAEWREEHMRREVLLLVGPPGVAKTSLGRSVARALGRNIYTTSFGAVEDAEEVHGFLETYIGSMPGIIIRGIIAAGSKNPVFVIDEIDKTGKLRGNPQAAFLAVLDSTLKGFTDKYMRVPFDLSEVLFILTANTLDSVLPALVDRAEVIELFGSTPRQKREIAKRHLVPKANIYHHTSVVFPDEILDAIRDRWTPKEAGVRNYERKIFAVCRKTIANPVDGPILPDMLSEFLGPEVVHDMPLPSVPEVGVALGLAYTEVGGRVMAVEVERHISDTKLRLEDQFFATGSVAEVMKESAIVALARVRKLAEDSKNPFGITLEEFEKSRFHVHVAPLGVKKDGPSATVTLFTAFVSALSGMPVNNTVAMTGELTQRGKVLAVGGLAQKFSAAYCEGVQTVLYPASLAGTVSELQKENPELEGIRFVAVETDREVLLNALVREKMEAT